MWGAETQSEGAVVQSVQDEASQWRVRAPRKQRWLRKLPSVLPTMGPTPFAYSWNLFPSSLGVPLILIVNVPQVVSVVAHPFLRPSNGAEHMCSHVSVIWLLWRRHSNGWRSCSALRGDGFAFSRHDTERGIAGPLCTYISHFFRNPHTIFLNVVRIYVFNNAQGTGPVLIIN